ncbi:MAG TPA: hypothetical protein VGD67_14625 [Pseudonocardiaceae bacterium]
MLAAVLVAAAVALAGCGGEVSGRAVAGNDPAAGTTTGPGQAPPAAPAAVRWMDHFCGTANFLIDAASVPPPSIPDDPAKVRQTFLDQLNRLSGVLGTALIDFRRLRDEPAGGGEVLIQLIYGDVEEAKSRVDVATAHLEGSPELTAAVLADVNEELAKGMVPLQRVVTTIGLLDLPAELDAAAGSAPNCNRPGPTS